MEKSKGGLAMKITEEKFKEFVEKLKAKNTITHEIDIDDLDKLADEMLTQVRKEKTKTECSKCGNWYETYPVILDDNELSLISELELRDKHYKDNKGLCEKCRAEEER